jgi:hypothetical protein
MKSNSKADADAEAEQAVAAFSIFISFVDCSHFHPLLYHP